MLQLSNKEAKDIVLNALSNAMGNTQDNLYRAKSAFGQLSPSKLKEKYGQSDQTCQEILDGYQEADDKIASAIIWIKSK